VLSAAIDPNVYIVTVITGVFANVLGMVVWEVMLKPILVHLGYISIVNGGQGAYSEGVLEVREIASPLHVDCDNTSVNVHISSADTGGLPLVIVASNSCVVVHVSGSAQKPPTTTESQ